MDAGPKSLDLFEKVIMDSKTILWNGPLGVFEFSNFSNGTKMLEILYPKAQNKEPFHLLVAGTQ